MPNWKKVAVSGSSPTFNNITTSGNISASGFVSASAFSGDGSGLTGITITTPSLQDVTDEGSSTTTSITTSNITSTGTISGSVLKSELFCVYQPGTSSPSILFDNSGSATGLAKITAQSSGGGSGGSLNFCTTVSPATSPAAHMNLRNGNLGIGIGTSNPQGKLDVRGNITSSGNIENADGYALFQGTTTNSSLTAALNVKQLSTAAANRGNIALFGNSTDSALVAINESGSVGIGTGAFDSPGEKLDVRGNITSSGYVKASCFIGEGQGLTNVTGSLNIVGNSGTNNSGTTINLTNTQKIIFSGNAVQAFTPAPPNPGSQISISINTGSASTTTGVFEAGTGTATIIPSLGSNINTGTFSTIAGGCKNILDTQSPTVVDFSFIGGGRSNSGSGDYGFLGGGCENITSGVTSFLGGGKTNKASGASTSLVGGSDNIASGSCSSVVGGASNHADGRWSTILGGRSNRSSAEDTIIGGRSNCIETGARCTAISSGTCNTIKGLLCTSYQNRGGMKSVIGGGNCHTIHTHACATIAGGYKNCITNTLNNANYQGNNVGTIGGGMFNVVGGFNSVVAGGAYHRAQNMYSGALSGKGNVSNGYASTVAGGRYNQIMDPSSFTSMTAPGYSFIGGGNYNTIYGTGATGNFIGSGYINNIQGPTTSANVIYSGILGGRYNRICQNDSFIIGSNIVANTACTTFMNNGIVACHLQVGGLTPCTATIGRIDATNDVVAFATSDKRLKENIKPISNALCKLNEVSGNTFNWKKLNKEQIKDIHGNTGKDVGVIAQEIESILPEAVTTRDSGYKAVNYEKIIPLLIEAIKDQQKQIDELKSRI